LTLMYGFLFIMMNYDLLANSMYQLLKNNECML